MRVVICAGGTGGHIYPALAILNKIKEYDKQSEILYIGTNDRMESSLVPSLGINYQAISMIGFNRKKFLENFKLFSIFRKAMKDSTKILKDFKPDVVIGAGGYVTVPVVLAAHKLHIKTVIHEQNSIAGMSNKFLATFVDKVCVSLPDTINSFPAKKVVYTGNPRSEEIINVKRASRSEYGFSKDKKLVVIVMGSLGSATMNAKIVSMVDDFKDKNYQVLIITGRTYYEDYKYIKTSSNVKLVPFVDSFINLLKDVDLIVSRAGASTIAEVTSIGLPSILVPSPYVTDNHQLHNAMSLEKVGACKIIEEKDFTSEFLLKTIDSILNDEHLYKNMALQAKTLGVRDSATKFYLEVKSLVGDKLWKS